MKAALQFSDQTSSGRYFHRGQNKKVALRTAKLRQDLPRRLSQHQELTYWRDELDYWQVEVNFYHYLLTMGSLNCKQDSRHRLDYLCHAFAVFQKEILPEMKSFLEDILSDSPSRDKTQWTTKQQELMEHAETLKNLKIEVFPHLPELLVVSIW